MCARRKRWHFLTSARAQQTGLRFFLNSAARLLDTAFVMIRKYDEQDLLLAAWEAASEVVHPFLAKEFLASERKNIPNLNFPNAETWVYEEYGRVVGFTQIS